jgi:hypothetical protein
MPDSPADPADKNTTTQTNWRNPMAAVPESPRYPLLESIARLRGLPLKAVYTIKDTAALFGVSPRTIVDWCRDGKLTPRDLPGHGRFLCEDLEIFLQQSRRPRQRNGGNVKIKQTGVFSTRSMKVDEPNENTPVVPFGPSMPGLSDPPNKLRRAVESRHRRKNARTAAERRRAFSGPLKALYLRAPILLTVMEGTTTRRPSMPTIEQQHTPTLEADRE